MKPLKIAKDIYWVGVIDWNIRDFHGYSTYQGTTYNSFGWSGEAVKLINSEFEEMKFEVVDPGIRIQYVPDDKDLAICYELGKKVAKALPEVKKIENNSS